MRSMQELDSKHRTLSTILTVNHVYKLEDELRRLSNSLQLNWRSMCRCHSATLYTWAVQKSKI
jgi:hypothetical protein